MMTPKPPTIDTVNIGTAAAVNIGPKMHMAAESPVKCSRI